MDIDDDETRAGVPTAEFDPARSQVEGARFLPFPTDLVRDPETGKLNLSEQACESMTSKVTRENVLNQLDGFGTYQLPVQFTFTSPVDQNSLTGRIAFYKITGGTPTEVPFVARTSTTLRFNAAACTAPSTVQTVLVIPRVPLDESSTYVVALRRGILTRDSGLPFEPSSTWALVSASTSPVTLDAQGNVIADRTPLDPSDGADHAQLVALAGMWKLHAPGLAVLDQVNFVGFRSELLVGTTFTTQTVRKPLDRSVAGTPANQVLTRLTTDFFQDPMSFRLPIPQANLIGLGCTEAVTDATNIQCTLRLLLGGCSPTTTGCGTANYNAGASACATPPGGLYDCAAIGDLMIGTIDSLNFQPPVPNPLAGEAPVPGPWSDPVNPDFQGMSRLGVWVTVPTGTAPAGGWPVVVFQHGLTGAKENILAVGGRLARAGFATVAIDIVAHGARAVRTSVTPALGCKGICYQADGTPTATPCETVAQCAAGQTCGTQVPQTAPAVAINPPTPSSAPQCYAPVFSTDLEATRDNLRQTVLDQQRLVSVLKKCTGTTCGSLKVDPNRIFYAGISLGGIIGTMATATIPDFKASVLNVPGAGLIDLLENTDALSLRCTVVDGLIDAGVLMGEKWNKKSDSTQSGLCTTPAWKTQPGYATFSAVARWIIDPADPANYATALRTRTHLIQEVTGDQVVPNITTERLAALTGVAGRVAGGETFTGAAPTAASAAISTNPKTSKYVTYTTSPSNTYVHSTWNRPASSAVPALLATMRLQIDIAQFLDNNDDDNF